MRRIPARESVSGGTDASRDGTPSRSSGMPCTGPGFVFMDTPGYDPRPAPTVKLATNSALANSMTGDIGVDCSGIVETGRPLGEVGEQVYRRLVEVASGDRSKSEEPGLGGEEMMPWQIGAVL